MQQPQQTPQTPRVAYRYANFYNECADYPELPKFRRLGAQWAKKLYDDVEELLKEQEELNDALATFRRAEGRDVLTLLECPRICE
ncbi:hypothetical protein BU26DRAFT_515670 [Trematosphaeria pertusa]|uniref:Uncharacterized protein n=1 Tax=Trematosphaeria pertusa TaxID=390896 RepID=A0A6A6ISB9_9PLEO|nr:uncharacterized protein BU26DRAFT_515670 [Trematosphaeria pertusa]KAF2253306.1 hypothetical protein BU26DRAFT_515670 [Trematosphaeria pertusa]